jgi:hypothetical protein
MTLDEERVSEANTDADLVDEGSLGTLLEMWIDEDEKGVAVDGEMELDTAGARVAEERMTELERTELLDATEEDEADADVLRTWTELLEAETELLETWAELLETTTGLFEACTELLEVVLVGYGGLLTLYPELPDT